MLLEHDGQSPITAQLLKQVTGYGDHTIADSLRTLESPTRQIIRRMTGGWKLAAGFQLPLEINRDIRGFDPSSCSSLNKKETNPLVEEQEENRDIRGFQNENREKCSFDRQSYDTAQHLGIRDPKASQIAALPGISPALIQAHVNQARADGRPLGTAIYRILAGWSPAPADPRLLAQSTASAQTGHPADCRCIDCQLARLGEEVCPSCRHVYRYCDCKET